MRLPTIQIGLSFALATVLATFTLNAHTLGEDTIRWAPNLEEARKASAQYKVPLLVHFYGNNCIPCRILDQRVYTNAELIDTLNKYFICVKINASVETKTAAEIFSVHSWPTDVFLSPDGKTLFQGICPQDVKGYMSTLQNVAVMNRDRNIMLAAQVDSPASQDTISESEKAQGMQAGIVGGHSQLNPAGADLQQSSMYAAEQQKALQQVLDTQREQQLAVLKKAQEMAASNGLTHPSIQSQATSQSQSSSQTLGPSIAPAKDVASGPLTANNQPQAQRSAVPGSQQQLAGPGTPTSNNTNVGQLPPRTQVATVSQPASQKAGLGTAAPGSYAAMPSLTNQPSGTEPSAAETLIVDSPVNTTPALTISNTNAHSLENPYFNSAPKQQGLATQQSPATQPKLAIAQPTIQPKATPAKLASATLSNAASHSAPQIKPAPQINSTPGTNSATTPSSQLLYQPRIQPSTTAPSVPATPVSTTLDTETQSASSPAQNPTKASMPENPSEPALDGYCPIALQTSNQWVEGKAEFAVRHRGRVYWLSNQQAMQSFLAAPDKASPILSGYDPLILLEEGRLVEGNIQHGLHEQLSDKFLLFSSAESKQKYWSDFDRYTKALNQLLHKAQAE